MQRGPACVGVALLAGSTLVLEVLLARITSVVAWYHLSFFVIALAMLGLTAGAVIVSCMPRWFAAAVIPARLRQLALAFACAAPIAVALALRIELQPIDDAGGFLSTLTFGALLAVPFACAGAALTLALTRAGLPPGLVYGVDLLGAAGGCAGVVLLLDLVDAPSAVLVAGVLAALAASTFARADPDAPARAGFVAFAIAAVLSVAAAINAGSGALLRTHWVKGQPDVAEQHAFDGWTTYSRVTVDRAVLDVPSFWAGSSATPRELRRPVAQRAIRIDGSAGTAMTAIDRDPNDGVRGHAEDHGYLGWDLTAFAHHVRPDGPALVIGAGGGRDVVEAVRVGHAPVVAIELNGLIVALHRGAMREFSGLVDLPGVELVEGEARAVIAADPRRFAVITMSLIDTWAATGAGAYALSENGLYTVEAWRLLLDRLAPGGIFTVSRWYVAGAPHETARLLALAQASLWARGVSDASRHLVLVQNLRIATLLVSESPWSAEQLATIEREAARLRFAIVLAPGVVPREPLLAEVSALPDADALARWSSGHALDLSPPTDDRPFFFNMLRPSAWLGSEAVEGDRDEGPTHGNELATQTLVHTTLVSALLAVLAIAVPLSARRRELASWPRAELFAAGSYFALIGLGFMLVEMALLSRLSILLGHPTLALAVLLGGMILFAGIGSLASSRLELSRVARVYPLASALTIALVAATLDAIASSSASASLTTRVAIAVVLIGTPAVAMGVCFPLGLRVCMRSDRVDLGPWAWGINGAFGVVASGLGLMLAMTTGTRATLLLGAICYAALLLCTRRLARQPASG